MTPDDAADERRERRHEDALLRSLADGSARTGQELHGLAIQVATLATQVGGLQATMTDVREQFRQTEKEWRDDLERFVEKVEFEPVKKVVFGMVGTMLLAILTAILAFVIQQGR